jgi:hypothetical protein
MFKTPVHVLTLLTAILYASATPAQIVFSDTFNRPDSSLSGAQGQSGSLAPLTYLTDPPSTVAGNSLMLGGTGGTISSEYGSVSPNASLPVNGFLRTSFTVDPNVGVSPAGFSGQYWGGVSFGHSATSAIQSYAVDTDADCAIGIIFRNNGLFQVLDSGTPVYETSFRTSVTGNEVYSVIVDIASPGVVLGGTGVMSVTVDGVPLPVGGAGVFARSFVWNRSVNYVVLGSESNSTIGSRFDNFELTSVPEPTSFLLTVTTLASSAVIYRRRRAHGQ